MAICDFFQWMEHGHSGRIGHLVLDLVDLEKGHVIARAQHRHLSGEEHTARVSMLKQNTARSTHAQVSDLYLNFIIFIREYFILPSIIWVNRISGSLLTAAQIEVTIDNVQCMRYLLQVVECLISFA